MAVTAIEAYHPETRADYVNIARTIACSITSLALLGKTADPDMTPPEKIRACGRAIALNRATDQSERTMMQRRRYRQAHAEPEPPPPPEPEIDDAEIEAAVAQAISQALNLTKTVKTDPPRPTPVPTPEATRPAPRSPIIRYDNPIPAAAPSRTASHKDQLLHHTAIHRLTTQTGQPHPA
jgi:hypothetical protein